MGCPHLATTEPPQEATQKNCMASSAAGNSCPRGPHRCPRPPSRHPSELKRCIGLLIHLMSLGSQLHDQPLWTRSLTPVYSSTSSSAEAWEDEENSKCPVSQQQSHSQILEYQGAPIPRVLSETSWAISQLPAIAGYRTKPALRLALRRAFEGLQGPAYPRPNCSPPPPSPLARLQGHLLTTPCMCPWVLPHPHHQHSPTHPSRSSFRGDLSKEASEIPPAGNHLFCHYPACTCSGFFFFF